MTDYITVPKETACPSGIVAVSVGSMFATALRGDGTVWAWGDNHYGELVPEQLTKFTSRSNLG
jgi:alpha-tubulin suppressor-like RCC1 family protein